MAASAVHSFDTQHEDMIHDAQLDYYGKKLATASSDRTVKIWEVAEKSQKLLAELKGHEGPVWQVAWAHPQFGNVLASCSYDHKVIVWREGANNAWQAIYTYSHQSSVNSIAWAPQELGLIIASASSDSTIVVHTYDESSGQFTRANIPSAHQIGCNAVSWGPATSIGSLTADKPASAPPVRQLVSGGGDNKVKIWCYDDQGFGKWELKETLEGHSDWVRDVSWAPNIGLPYDTIASCSQDKTVYIWTRTAGVPFSKTLLKKFDAVVWRVSWSITGNILAVSSADNKVTLWKETEGKWVEFSSLTSEQGAQGATTTQGVPMTQ